MQGSTVGAYVNRLGTWVLLAAVLMSAFAFLVAQILVAQTKATKPVSRSFPPAVVERGQSLFSQDCAFCHGRDAGAVSLALT
jgi:mono/diheme cytochrome c family protein